MPDISHKPFEDAVTVAGIKDDVEVLRSLQAPKKVCFCFSVHFVSDTVLLLLAWLAMSTNGMSSDCYFI